MNNSTTSKKKYIEEWINYIDQLVILQFVKDPKLAIEIDETINKLKGLVIKVANSKGLK